MPVGDALERRRGAEHGRLAGRPADEREPDGQSSTKPHGTLATGAPASDQGELNGISASRYGISSPCEHDRLLADQRRETGIAGCTSRSKRSKTGRSSRRYQRRAAQPRHVGGRGQQQPGEQSRADVRPVVGQPRAQPRRGGPGRLGSMIVWTIVPASSSSGIVDRLDVRAERASSSTADSRARCDLGVGALEELARRRRSGARRRRRPGSAGTRGRAPGAAGCSPRRVLASGPDRVEAPRGRDDAVVRHEARRRPQPGDAAEAGRDPDRAGRVGAERPGDEVGGDRGTAAAARAAADAIGRPRVAGRAEMRARRQRAERELVRVQLADARRRRPREGARPSRRRAPRRCRGGSRDAAVVRVSGDVDHVLDRDRNAVQRAVRAPCSASASASSAAHGDEGVERRGGSRSGQVGLHRLPRARARPARIRSASRASVTDGAAPAGRCARARSSAGRIARGSPAPPRDRRPRGETPCRSQGRAAARSAEARTAGTLDSTCRSTSIGANACDERFEEYLSTPDEA